MILHSDRCLWFFVRLGAAVGFFCSRSLCSSSWRLAGNLEWDAAWKLRPHDLDTLRRAINTFLQSQLHLEVYSDTKLPDLEDASASLPHCLNTNCVLSPAIVFSPILPITSTRLLTGLLGACVCYPGHCRSGQLMDDVQQLGLASPDQKLSSSPPLFYALNISHSAGCLKLNNVLKRT